MPYYSGRVTAARSTRFATTGCRTLHRCGRLSGIIGPFQPFRCRGYATCPDAIVCVVRARLRGRFSVCYGCAVQFHARGQTMYDARTTSAAPADAQCGQVVAGSHPRTCLRERGHAGRHRSRVVCVRCESRPPRHPRGWAGAKVSGPALCARCAREVVSIARSSSAAPSEDL